MLFRSRWHFNRVLQQCPLVIPVPDDVIPQHVAQCAHKWGFNHCVPIATRYNRAERAVYVYVKARP